jgi:YcxB-like protein
LREPVEIRAEYTEALIARATKRFWVRFIDWHGFAAIAVAAVLVVYLFVVDGPTATVLAFAGVLVFAIAVGTAVYYVYRNRALSVFRRMGTPHAVFKFTDEGISTRSDLGGGDMSWRGITKVWVFPEVWLIFMAKGAYVTIPTNAMTPDVRSLIRAKVLEHGGKVV